VSEPAQPNRILIASEVRFWRADSGAAMRIGALCAGLAHAGFEVAVFYPGHMGPADRTSLAASHPGVALYTPSLAGISIRALRRRLSKGNGLAESSLPLPLRRPWVRERRAAFERILRVFRPDAVIVEYAYLSYLVERADAWPLPRPRPRLLLDTHDVLSLRAARFRAQGRKPEPDITHEEERAALMRYDTLLAIQEDEAAALRALCPERNVIVAAHPAELKPLPPRQGAGVRLLFAGGPAVHNLHALQWFLEQVWPQARAANPQLELWVAGAVCAGLPAGSPEGLRILGRIDDLEAAYADTDIAINPIRMGSGLKIKNIEALGYGRPLITTTIGAEGMGPGAGTAYVVADTPEEWLGALAALAGNAEARDAKGTSAAAYAAERFSESAAFAALIAYLRLPG